MGGMEGCAHQPFPLKEGDRDWISNSRLPVLRAGPVQDICVCGFTQLLQFTGVWSVKFGLCFRQMLPHLE